MTDIAHIELGPASDAAGIKGIYLPDIDLLVINGPEGDGD